MRKNFGVIGLGKFGSNLALTLEKLGHQVMAFDSNESKVDKLKDYVTLVGILDSTDKKALDGSGIKACDAVIVSVGEDAAASFLTVLNLKEIGVKNIIVKAKMQEDGRILEKIGATRVMYPEMESAVRLAHQLTSSDILEYLEVSPDYQVAEMDASKEFVGKKLEELHIIRKHNVLVLAIRRGSKTIIIPGGKEEIVKGDVLIIVGQTNDIVDFIKKFSSKNGK
ncbi:TrkA family potassium uptake protein [Candidatus Woesearchaeota archaeon]|nr:TrkA family potassium uptake protein [Candidatus Woesearchaeota archaeon]